LLQDADGRINGVVAVKGGKEFTVRTKSVIIGAGAIGGNRGLIKRFCPDYYLAGEEAAKSVRKRWPKSYYKNISSGLTRSRKFISPRSPPNGLNCSAHVSKIVKALILPALESPS